MWKSIITSFIIVFLAELGDKTQLSTMILSSKSDSIWYTFIGSSIALVLSSLIGVLVGSCIHKYLPGNILSYLSGGAFILIGLFLVFGKM